MTGPTCPKCGAALDYDEQLDCYYEGDAASIQWRGGCHNCEITYKWWENYELTSIEGMEEEEDEAVFQPCDPLPF